MIQIGRSLTFEQNRQVVIKLQLSQSLCMDAITIYTKSKYYRKIKYKTENNKVTKYHRTKYPKDKYQNTKSRQKCIDIDLRTCYEEVYDIFINKDSENQYKETTHANNLCIRCRKYLVEVKLVCPGNFKSNHIITDNICLRCSRFGKALIRREPNCYACAKEFFDNGRLFDLFEFDLQVKIADIVRYLIMRYIGNEMHLNWWNTKLVFDDKFILSKNQLNDKCGISGFLKRKCPGCKTYDTALCYTYYYDYEFGDYSVYYDSPDDHYYIPNCCGYHYQYRGQYRGYFEDYHVEISESDDDVYHDEDGYLYFNDYYYDEWIEGYDIYPRNSGKIEIENDCCGVYDVDCDSLKDRELNDEMDTRSDFPKSNWYHKRNINKQKKKRKHGKILNKNKNSKYNDKYQNIKSRKQSDGFIWRQDIKNIENIYGIISSVK